MHPVFIIWMVLVFVACILWAGAFHFDDKNDD
jgi:hypothetical protein